MASDEMEIQKEIDLIKEQLACLGDKTCDILTRERLLRHRLYDLEYEAKHCNDK